MISVEEWNKKSAWSKFWFVIGEIRRDNGLGTAIKAFFGKLFNWSSKENQYEQTRVRIETEVVQSIQRNQKQGDSVEDSQVEAENEQQKKEDSPDSNSVTAGVAQPNLNNNNGNPQSQQQLQSDATLTLDSKTQDGSALSSVSSLNKSNTTPKIEASEVGNKIDPSTIQGGEKKVVSCAIPATPTSDGKQSPPPQTPTEVPIPTPASGNERNPVLVDLCNELKETALITRINIQDNQVQNWLGNMTQEEARYFVDFCRNWNFGERNNFVPTQERLDDFIKFIKFNSVQIKCIEKWLEEDHNRRFRFPGFAANQQIIMGNGDPHDIDQLNENCDAGGTGEIIDARDPFGGTGSLRYVNNCGNNNQSHSLGGGLAARTTPGIDQNFWLGRQEFFNFHIDAMIRKFMGRVECGNVHWQQRLNHGVVDPTCGIAGGMNGGNWNTWQSRSGGGVANGVWIKNPNDGRENNNSTDQSYKNSVYTRWGLHTMDYGYPDITELDDTTPERRQTHEQVLQERNNQLLKNIPAAQVDGAASSLTVGMEPRIHTRS